MTTGRRNDDSDATLTGLGAGVAALEGGRLSLVVVDGTGARTLPLPPEGRLLIGRKTGAWLQLNDRLGSREHAELIVRGQLVVIRDLRSQNGTWVGGVRISGECPLQPGEAVRIGSLTLVIQRAGADGPVKEPTIDEELEELAELPDAPEQSRHVVRSPSMVALHALLRRVAAGRIPVLVMGETGTGKEVIAEQVHKASPRAAMPLVRINCAALPAQLLEAEFFGYERGAFTGADRAKGGLFEEADRGTLLLDEIGEMPLDLQGKLLRVLEDGRVRRVGGLQDRPVDVRIVACTNRNLTAAIGAGTFRADLYWRLCGTLLVIPPLRDRREEILPLARLFANAVARDLGRQTPRISPEAARLLKEHPWPGNIRQLRHVMERAVLLASDDILPEHVSGATGEVPPLNASGPRAGPRSATVPQLPAQSDPQGLRGIEETDPQALSMRALGDAPGATASFKQQKEQAEREAILDALERAGQNQTQAAALLGMPRRTFVEKLDRYGVARPRKRPGGG